MKHLKIQQDIDPIERLEAINARLTVESFSVNDYKQTFNSVIPAITSALEETSKKSKSLFKGLFSSFVSNESLIRDIEKINFSELASLNVYVPEGFHGRMSDYVETLIKCTMHANLLIERVLIPYNSIISSFISNPDNLKNNFINNQWDAGFTKKLEDLNKEVSTYFKSSTTSTQVLSKTYFNASDFRATHLALKTCINEIEKVNLKQLNKLIDDALEITKALQSIVKEKNVVQASDVTIKFLADITLTLAKELEFYGINRHRVEITHKCVQDTFDKLKKSV